MSEPSKFSEVADPSERSPSRGSTDPLPLTGKELRRAELVADPQILAAMDIGTNSMRLSIVRLNDADRTWTTLAQYKETVRLGQGEFEASDGAGIRLTDDAISRGVLVLSTFAEIARGYGAGEIVAIATAALREAANRHEFIERARDWAGVEVQVVSGVEEARLIYLGVASGIELGQRRALFIDIGGGSTELIIGDQSQHYFLDSLKLGAIRLGNLYLEGVVGAIPASLFARMQQHVRNVASHALRRIGQVGYELVVGSSGTATNLARVAAYRNSEDPNTLQNYLLRSKDLASTLRWLAQQTLEERRQVPGLNPERADIILSGGAVLLTLVEELGVEGITIAERSLREGVLVDALLRRSGEQGGYEAGVRRRSVEYLARFTENEIEHSRHVARLALSLFDQFRALGLHNYGSEERELLEYAALLHDIGIAVSRSAHHRHSHYLIRNSELAGFTDEEIQIIANLAYFHRKSLPKKRHEHFQALSREAQQMVRTVSCCLRLAEGLDRSHLALVREVTVAIQDKTLLLTLLTASESPLERWYVTREAASVEEVFGLKLEVQGAVGAG